MPLTTQPPFHFFSAIIMGKFMCAASSFMLKAGKIWSSNEGLRIWKSQRQQIKVQGAMANDSMHLAMC
jgi:hypothetical protein